ncbi:MAG: HD domain-containing protein [Candidatus Staskawiczbacteria bacterium]|nr:HD domain-containing protein [Candidatus Staskawiczbacteria bacterium]
MSNDLEKILKQLTDKAHPVIRRGAPSNDGAKLISTAFEFATQAYKEKNRLSGENYIFHAARVALMLDKMNLDSTTIAFGILHDVLDDTPTSAKKIEIKEIEKKFGKEMGHLVEKTSELSRVRYSLIIGMKDKKAFTKEKAENLRRMFLAISGDLRVVLIELLSRLDGLNLLHYLPEDKQKLFSLETLQIFVPVANRLGLSEIRRKLEDLAFSHLFPDRFKWLKENIKSQYEEREKYLKKFIPRLKKILRKEGVKILDINYRAKSYWSAYQKLMKHQMNFDEVHDLLALRIITADVESCYRVLGIIHKHFKPISEEINDYIAKPKPNGYRSLHTTIFSNENKITEIQIRTDEMHKEAEYGVCAHWSYKEKIDLKKEGKNFEWVESVPEFWKTFKIDFFANQVFTFTPRGDIVVLPKNSTPIDFAYAVHSEIGNHCESAKIDGKIVQLDSILKNGDVVEISINKNKIPSKDWMRFVRTSLAKSHIKKITGEDKPGFRFPLPEFIRKRITEFSEASKKRQQERQKAKEGTPKQIYLAGQKGMLTHIAKCCNPQPGDKVSGYLAQNRSAVLHKTSCDNFKKIAEKFPGKIVDASWQ